jgi:hypothetical protein
VWWLTPIILATQEVEIQGMEIQGQTGQKVEIQGPISINNPGVVVDVCGPLLCTRLYAEGPRESAGWSIIQGRHRQSTRPYPKNNESKMGWVCGSLPTKRYGTFLASLRP